MKRNRILVTDACDLFSKSAHTIRSIVVVLKSGLTQELCQRWRTVFLVAALWAVCQGEAPLFPSLTLSQVCQRLLLAGSLWTSLGLCALSIRTLLRCNRRLLWLHVLEAEEIEEAVVKSAAYPGARAAPEPSSGLSGVEAHALIDCLLVFLCWESLQNASLADVQDHADKLEKASKPLQKVTGVLSTWPQGGSNEQEVSAPAERLQSISNYLESRSRLLRDLLQAQAAYQSAVQVVQGGLGCCWEQLEEMHGCVTIPMGSESKVDVERVLREMEQGLSEELVKQENGLQLCEACVRDSSILLQELDHCWQGLLDQGGTSIRLLWTDKLRQADSMQLAELRSKIVSLEHLVFCLRTHLEGLRDGGVCSPAHNRLPSTPPASTNCLCCPLW